MMIYKGICVVAITCLVCSCNGLPGSASGDLPPQRPPGHISGYVFDAAIAAAQVTVYAFDHGVKGERLGGGVTDADGFFSTAIDAGSRAILVEAVGGNYRDGISGAAVQLQDGQVLRAVVFYPVGGNLSLMITPLTHIAAGLAEFRTGQGLDIARAVTTANTDISAIFGIPIMTTRPRDITASDDPGAEAEEYVYGFLLAGIASWADWVARRNGADGEAVFTSVALTQVMYNDIRADGLLDGQGSDKTGERTPLAFGAVPLHRDIYRIALAQHMMAITAGELNRTALTVKDLTASARQLASSRDALFGGDAPVAGAPSIIALEPEGTYHNGVFEYPVAVRGLVDAQSVTFYLDGEYLGEAADPQSPYMTIDTGNYRDGDHTVMVVAHDALDKKTEGKFLLRVDNTAPFVNVTSTPATNQKRYVVQGNFGDNGAGVRFITVAGVTAQLADKNTWSVELDLAQGRNTLPIVVTDRVGNEFRAETIVDFDEVPPVIESASHSQARFSLGDGTFETAALGDQNEQPLYLETSHVDLNGISISRATLDRNGIPYFAISVHDPEKNGAATPSSDIEVRVRYRRDMGINGDWRRLEPQNGEYLIPLVTEMLHAQWYRATPMEQHIVEVAARDQAGNEGHREFSFRTDFFVAPFEIRPAIDEAQSFFAHTPFSQRRALHQAVVSAIAYTFTNTTGKAFFLSLDDHETHHAELTLEQMVREHQARLKNATEWRIAPIREAKRQCPSASDWRTVTTVFNYDGRDWQPLSVPSPSYGETVVLSSDELPSASPLDDWSDVPDFDNVYFKDESSFWYKLSLEYDYVEDPNRPRPASVRNWSLQNLLVPRNITTCPDVRYFQQRHSEQFESVPGYPRNVSSTFTESEVFSTSGFIVEDVTANTVIAPYQGWYLIPADHMVTLHKQVTTPAFNVYDDDVVGDTNTFRSYDPLRYDKRLMWAVNRALSVTVAHDAGEENVFAVSSRSFRTGEGVAVFELSR